MLLNRFMKVLLVLCVILLGGCTSSVHSPEYLTSVTQVPPQPVYNRIFLARPPEVLPYRKKHKSISVKENPVFQLDVSNETVESVIKTLASASRFRGYTSATIADSKVSLQAVGTIDELADALSKAANIHISVDHANRELRAIRARNGGS